MAPRSRRKYSFRTFSGTRFMSYSERMDSRRLDWIDGLRGMAVLMVVLFHAWSFAGYAPELVQNSGRPTVVLASLATWGVSLFLVLSGFCLSYRPLVARAAGRRDWFSLRAFVVHRCRRILPPYYAALVLFSGLALYFKAGGRAISIMPPPSAADFLAHLALLHNNVPQFATTINTPFWSLGLEWQWYWIFPAGLLCCLRWPGQTLSASVILSVIWARASYLAPALDISHMLPGRLTEFCCGIVGARFLAEGRSLRSPALACGVIFGLAPGLILPAALQNAGLYYPLCGVGFGSLLLLASRPAVLGRFMGWRPLVQLGAISYSLYLVHWPLLGAVESVMRFGAHASPAITIAVGVVVVLPFGWSFHILFERPFNRRSPRPTGPQPSAHPSPLPAEPNAAHRRRARGEMPAASQN